MEFVLTPAQMAACDRATIEAGTPIETLMERAGWALARAVRDVVGGSYGRRVVLVCGKGNNGGDARVAAAVLEGWGTRTEVYPLDPALDRNGLLRSLDRADAAVDAMYGTGFRGALEGEAAFAAEALNASGLPVIACDVPSGTNGLTGAVDGPAVEALLTVSFAAPKTGLLFEPARSHAGQLRVAPIGVDITQAPGHLVCVLDEGDIDLLLPVRDPDTHKWAVGALFIVAGKAGMLGAATMVAQAALRTGAGLVMLGVPGQELAARAAGSEVITQGLPATAEGFLDEPATKEVIGHLERFRALVVGPGLGTDDRTVAAVRHLVADAPVPVLVDADGLNALAGDLGPLLEREQPVVLTPHVGEFERLTGRPMGDDRVGAVCELAARTGAVVLLKGSTTVVADPEGRVVLNRTGGPWLASAGTGDVLSGIVGSLLAQGLPALEAAAVGSWIHGRAADEVGREGLVATDLIGALPATLAHVRRAGRT